MGKGLLAALLGAVAMFVWGYVSWTVLHLHENKSFRSSAAIAKAMRSSGDETGVYWIPAMPEKHDTESDDWKTFEEAHKSGPRAMVVYQAGGAEVMDPMVFAKGYLAMFGACLVVVALLFKARIGNYVGRVLFVASFGLFVALYTEGANWSWFGFPTKWVMQMAIDHLITWGIAGAVIAALVKPASS